MFSLMPHLGLMNVYVKQTFVPFATKIDNRT